MSEPTDFDRLPPEVKALMSQIVQATGMAATEVDPTIEAVTAHLDTMGVSNEERNALLSTITRGLRDNFIVKPGSELSEYMPLMDMVWLGALVHNYRKELGI